MWGRRLERLALSGIDPAHPVFLDFLRRLLPQTPGRFVMIFDGHPMYRAARVQAFMREQATPLRLVLLPGYCPELNLDEVLNLDVRTNAVGKNRRRDRTELIRTVCRCLHRRHKQPRLIRALFRERHVRYAA